MNIGIDIRVLAKGTRTGVEDYTINLLSFLLAKDKSIKYRLFYNGFRKPNLTYPFLKFPNVELKTLRFPNRLFDLSLRFLKFPKLDKILKGVSLFLSPHFLLTPVSKKTKTIIVFYDLSFVRFPDFFSLPKLLWHRFIYPEKQAKKADIIIAISQSTKEDLINLYKIEPRKIRVVYPGIDKKFRPITDNIQLLRVKKRYNLSNEFILYFGTIEPRKNLISVIKAFEILKRKFSQQDLKLVIAGTPGWLYKDIFKKAESSKYQKDIIFTGFIKEEDKPYLYNLARVFVYPSFFEGFGLPPLEAMACGVPTVVSNVSSLPEVVGSGAIMIDPYNVDELAYAIGQVLNDKNLRENLIRKGLNQAKKFDWDRAAKQVLEIFKNL